MATAKDLAEAFEIFAKYEEDDHILDAEYEKLLVWIDPGSIDPEDKERLEKIGFNRKQKSQHGAHFYYFT